MMLLIKKLWWSKKYWYGQIKELGDKNIIICLAANKYDLYEKREVSNEEGEEFAKSIGAIFASTLAQKKEDSGIKFLFENMAWKILEPDFDFYAEEQKKKEAYLKKKKEEKSENNGVNNSNKIFKLNTQKEKKKKCCW